MAKSKTCSIDGCERNHKAHGLCGTHLYRRDKGLPMDGPVRQYEHERICKIDGCEKSRVDGGDGQHCQMHRRRVIRRGDPGSAERQRAPFGEADWDKPNVRRRKKLLDGYGLTADEYNRLLAKQKGRCAVCGGSSNSSRASSDLSFCVDHDHITGQVRGLLCGSCNRAIGMLKDDPAIIEAAAQYVRSHRQVPLFGPAGPLKKKE